MMDIAPLLESGDYTSRLSDLYLWLHVGIQWLDGPCHPLSAFHQYNTLFIMYIVFYVQLQSHVKILS